MKNTILGRLILQTLLTFALCAPMAAMAQEAWEEHPADAAAQADKWGFNAGAGAR